jgi:KpsF/GutQ family protein/monovalent cation:proton antiporter-2 (CPA2) family protein
MLGYLAVGVVIGPHALAISKNSDGVRHLGEFGVVFLMFVIGLEFNLPKLRSMRRHVFGLGLLQVALTMLLVTLGSVLLVHMAPSWWEMPWQTALALSGAMAMSSTAIVVKLLAERLELASEHGKRIMGVLLFQDLAVVPLLVLIPALGSSPDRLFMALGLAGLKAAVLLGLLLTGGQRIMRWWLTIVARRKSEELFVLNLLLVTLALAWLTELAGLSLALGAFIAGMLISETQYKHQVETDIRPFHDVLLGLFFISVGMMLDWHEVVNHWALVLMLLTLPVLFKLVMGMGKSGHIGRKIAATLASTGTPAMFVHPAEASHGDLGMIQSVDVVLAISNSGESEELVAILPVLSRLGIALIAITGGPESTLARQARITLDTSVAKEACPLNLAPTASTTAQLAMGDALAVALLDARGFREQDFARSHPGGALGRKLLTHVKDVMRSGQAVPHVLPQASFSALMREMSAKGLGASAIVDATQGVLGIFTDGDLRRLIEKGEDLRSLTAADVMHAHPRTVRTDALAVEAVALMEQYRINSVLVVDEAGVLCGALNTNDLMRAKVI